MHDRFYVLYPGNRPAGFIQAQPTFSTPHLPDVVMVGLGQLLTSIPESLESLVLLLNTEKWTGKAIG